MIWYLLLMAAFSAGFIVGSSRYPGDDPDEMGGPWRTR